MGLRGRRPGFPAPPRRAPGAASWGDSAGAAALLPPVLTLSRWVTGPRRSCRGPGSFRRREDAGFPAFQPLLHARPAARLSAPPCAPGYPPPWVPGAPPAAQPGGRGRAGSLAPCPAPGGCFPLVQGRTAGAEPEAVGDPRLASRCLLVSSQTPPCLTCLNTWQSKGKVLALLFACPSTLRARRCVALGAFPAGSCS